MPFDDPIAYIHHQLIYLSCNWYNSVMIHEFEGVYDPDYLNLDPLLEDSWKIYAEKVRNIIAECLQIPKCEFGYRDWKDFNRIYKEEYKKLR